MWRAPIKSPNTAGHPLPDAKRVRGFTLIEVLLVVGLVAVLAAIAMPAYSSYKNRARTFQAVHDITLMSATIKNSWNDARAYPGTLAEVGMNGQLDPWGRPYIYYNVDANGRGHARKDHALNPINSDFDLYSMGPDGVTKPQLTQRDSIDDIIRAHDGAFVGVAAAF